MTDKPMPLTAEEEREMRCDYADTVGRVASLLATLDAERAARAAAERERDNYESGLQNLLAIIHRDGGQHSEHVGIAAATVEAHDIVTRLRSENADLRAVVERLPLSADGVRITPGMSVWTPKGMFSGTAVREHTPVLVGDEDMLGEVEEYLWTWYAKSCYSTRAAAEAARRAPDAAERGGG